MLLTKYAHGGAIKCTQVAPVSREISQSASTHAIIHCLVNIALFYAVPGIKTLNKLVPGLLKYGSDALAALVGDSFIQINTAINKVCSFQNCTWLITTIFTAVYTTATFELFSCLMSYLSHHVLGFLAFDQLDFYLCHREELTHCGIPLPARPIAKLRDLFGQRACGNISSLHVVQNCAPPQLLLLLFPS